MTKLQLTLPGDDAMGGELYFEHASDSFAVNVNGQLMFLSLENAAKLRDYLSARLGGEPRASTPECICPNCGLRHGGSKIDGGF
jgi:hypothetical protein